MVWAYGHPLRWAIWRHFVDAGVVASPADIAKQIGARVENVAYHVRRLHERGLLRLVRTEKRRGREARMYTPVTTWISDDVWEQLPTPMKRAVTVRTLASIARDLRTQAERGGFDRRDILLSYQRLSVSDEEWRSLRRAVDRLHERARTLRPRDVSQAAADDDPDGLSANLLLMLFEEPRGE
ncbi:MAG: hypothetical protein QOJ29_2412 [Thermoleophilaceae bacterium]|nr:hypothetical protein [Thermoleophilaceae bacterium]